MPNETETVKTVEAEIQVVLNGGGHEVDSGGVPFRWFFNDKTIEQQPTHVFVIDETQSDIDENARIGRMEYGVRTVTKITHGSGFIQFLKPGRHRLTFMAVKLIGKYYPWQTIDSFLEKSSYGGYQGRYEVGFKRFHTDKVCMAEVEVEVPEALFAKKPRSAFGLWFWNFVNRWHGSPVRDECDFRRRIPLAAVCGVFYLLAKALQYTLYAPLATLYLILARLITFAVGYRPTPIFHSVGTIWQWEFAPSGTEWELRKWGDYSYSVWVPSNETVERKTRWMPITGSELLGWVFVVWGTHVVIHVVKLVEPEWYLATFAAWFITAFKCLLAAILLLPMNERVRETAWHQTCRWWIGRYEFLFRAWKTKRMARRAANEAVRTVDRAVARSKTVKSDLYFEWLRETSHTSKRTERVEIRELPEAFKAPIIHRFRVAAWALKRRFCKPYSH